MQALRGGGECATDQGKRRLVEQRRHRQPEHGPHCVELPGLADLRQPQQAGYCERRADPNDRDAVALIQPSTDLRCEQGHRQQAERERAGDEGPRDSQAQFERPQRD